MTSNLLRHLTTATTHKLLLALALKETSKSAHPILELGLGRSATQELHDDCEQQGRLLISIEEDILVAGRNRQLSSVRHEIRCVSFDAAPFEANLWSVALVDHSPGDRRWQDVQRLSAHAEIIVIHDTEPAADYGYKFSQIWNKFKCRVDVKTDGAWASAVSNLHDLSSWRGIKIGPFVVSGGNDDIRSDQTQEEIRKFLETPVE